MQVLNVHGAVACACHQNVSLTESIAQLKDTDHTRSYDTKNILVHTVALEVALCDDVYAPMSM